MIDDLEVDVASSALPSSMSLDFESLSDFTLDFYPWFIADVKGGNTYQITNHTFQTTATLFLLSRSIHPRSFRP